MILRRVSDPPINKLRLKNQSIRELGVRFSNSLTHIILLDLSENLLEDLRPEVFTVNFTLKELILRSNCLDEVPMQALQMLLNLQHLDLSYNLIKMLDKFSFEALDLVHLDLSHNRIFAIAPNSFHGLINLGYLNLSFNRLLRVHEYQFGCLRKLTFLLLDNNFISGLSVCTFSCLSNLQVLNLRANEIREINQVFDLNTKLRSLNLKRNPIQLLDESIFKLNKNLVSLKIDVEERFDFLIISPLTLLECFKFRSLIEQEFTWSEIFVGDPMKFSTIVVLKLIVFRFIIHNCLYELERLRNLMELHLECLKPNNEKFRLNFVKKIGSLEKLKTLKLRHLNHLKLSTRMTYNANLYRLLVAVDLSAVQNKKMPIFFANFINLTYLNLSKSCIKTIESRVFNYLVQLKTLIWSHAKVKNILRDCFSSNINLVTIDFSYSKLKYIEDFSFCNLTSLRTLDVSNNLLKTINSNTFFVPHPDRLFLKLY